MIDIETTDVRTAAAPVNVTITPAVVPAAGASPLDVSSAAAIAPLPAEIASVVNEVTTAVTSLSSTDQQNATATEAKDHETAGVIAAAGGASR